MVQSRILIQMFQMFCKFLRTGEVVHMKERIFRGNSLIIFSSSSHHYGKNLEFESIPELFSDVIYTIAVLKCKVEFVLFGHHFPAVRVFSPRTSEISTFSKNVHRIMLGKLFSILQPLVVGITVADKPGYSSLSYTSKVR